MSDSKELKNEDVARDIIRAAKEIKYGYIQVTIQNSRIVQIDRTEKIRLDNRTSDRGGRV